MSNEGYKKQIKENEDNFISELMECLKKDPNADEYDKNYKHLRGYLQELTNKESSLLLGLIIAIEGYLEK